jgi:hypothetical protein
MLTSSLVRAQDLALRLVVGRVVRCVNETGYGPIGIVMTLLTDARLGVFRAPSRPPMSYSKRRDAKNG